MFAWLLVALAATSSAVPYEFGPAAPEEVPAFQTMMICPENGPMAFSDSPTLAALSDGGLVCAWYGKEADSPEGMAVMGSFLAAGAPAWTAPRILVDAAVRPVLYTDADGLVHLVYGVMGSKASIMGMTSRDGGKTWSEANVLLDTPGYLPAGQAVLIDDETRVLPVEHRENRFSRVLLLKNGADSAKLSAPVGNADTAVLAPAVLLQEDGGLRCLSHAGSGAYHAQDSFSSDGGKSWSAVKRSGIPNPGSAVDLIRLHSGNVLMALNPDAKGDRSRLSLWLSGDDGKRWMVRRDVVQGATYASNPALLQCNDGRIHLAYSRPNGGIEYATFNEAWIWERAIVRGDIFLANVVPPLANTDDPHAFDRRPEGELPLTAPARVEEHVGSTLADTKGGDFDAVHCSDEGLSLLSEDTVYHLDAEGVWSSRGEYQGPAWIAPEVFLDSSAEQQSLIERLTTLHAGVFGGGPLESQHYITAFKGQKVTDSVSDQQTTWIGTEQGLFLGARNDLLKKLTRHPEYGVNGPLSTRITALALAPDGTLWVGTPLGISLLDKEGVWTPLRGKKGLPYEDVTDIEFSSTGDIWIATTRGVILHRPDNEARQWYYRAGQRYLPHDHVKDIAVSADGKKVYCATEAGVGCIELTETTLLEKAEKIEERINTYHRRLGLVADCTFPAPDDFSSHHIQDYDNDGLWTAYHVTAMALRYATTAEEAAKASAKEGMHALYMLQNASGIPGLVARSVVTLEEGKDKSEQWRLMADGEHYWKSDTSNDEIDGHFMAFYSYWEYVAQYDPDEAALCETQVRTVMDYIVDHGYQLIDWDGERTRWGFWDPATLSEHKRYLENGLGSLQILSFLRTTYHITGDTKYKDHYDRLIVEHNYLSNVLLEKKLFPDSNNHSDNQLACVAWYPLLQLEWDPKIRQPLHQAARRHYLTLARDNSSFFNFVLATIDPHYVSIEGALQNLIEIPTDRRQWRMENSQRADVVFDPRVDRFGKQQLLEVLPADERNMAKWNRNVYLPDHGAGGQVEDDGAAYLLPYWMGRYHGFIQEAE